MSSEETLSPPPKTSFSANDSLPVPSSSGKPRKAPRFAAGQCEEFNPVLFFKPQDEKSDFNGVEGNDFLLGLQTQFQKEMSTPPTVRQHMTSNNTVLVIDDCNEGTPVAWLISNKETTNALKMCFLSFRERCGKIQTET